MSNTIHTFTDAQGVKWHQFAARDVHSDSSATAGVIVFESGIAPIAGGKDMSGYGFVPLEEMGKDSQVCVPADRCETVTEHVEATVLDALQALLDNNGNAVNGWRRSADGDDDTLVAAGGCSPSFRFLSDCPFWAKRAFRPVTRVRIKAEVKPVPKFKVGDLVESLERRGKVKEVSDSGLCTVVDAISGGWWYMNERDLSPWKPGYGFTLDGNPVPQPPEGWEIVPEGESVPESEHMYFPSHTDFGWRVANVFLGDESGRADVVDETGFLVGVRAYARRVVTAPETAEESWVLGASSVAPTLMHTNYTSIGLTKREAFAMAAMQGILASYDKQTYRMVAMDAVGHADALLAELEKGKEAK